MEFIKPGINIDFVGKRKIAVAVSLLINIAVILMLIIKGPLYGVDFAGGLLIQVKFKNPVSTDQIRSILKETGIKEETIQGIGSETENEFLIRVPGFKMGTEEVSSILEATFEKFIGKDGFEIRRAEVVGPKVGKELRKKGMLAVTYSIILMLIYISWRFDFSFGLGAIIALIHDVLVTLGALMLTGRELDLTIVAALLTVVGYSVNDTIIISDRIRENKQKYKGMGLEQLINRSINETLSRTILTVLTVMLVVLALYLLGGPVINAFAFSLLVGFITGTYSSIFIAAPVVIFWSKYIPAKKR